MIRTLPTTLLQIFCKIIPNSKDIVKSIIAPDDNFRMKPYALMGIVLRFAISTGVHVDVVFSAIGHVVFTCFLQLKALQKMHAAFR